MGRKGDRTLALYYFSKNDAFEEGGFCNEVSFLSVHSGKWLTPFDPVLTETDTFYLDKYKAVKVPMMYRAGKFASTFDKNFRCHVLKLPYRGNATMLVVLMGRIGDHLALEDYLTTDLVDTWLRNMKTRYSSLVTLPQLSRPLPTGTHNFVLCPSQPSPLRAPRWQGLRLSRFPLYQHLSQRLALSFTRPALIKFLPHARHWDACTMPALAELMFW